MCPITKSAKRALRQSKKRKVRNIQKKKIIKKLLKEIKNLVTRAQAKPKELKPFLTRSNELVREDEQSSLTTRAQAKREDEQSSLTSQKKSEEAKKLLPQVYKLLDKAAKTGLIKKNTVARKKSRITKLINKSQQ